MQNQFTPEQAARFWAKVSKSDGCWLWTGWVNPQGYGIWNYRHPGRRIPAHRAAYLLTHGSIPDGLFVCHHCDNPPCCRPEHLYAGTPQDNVADMVSRGRQVKGDKSWARAHPEAVKRGEDHWTHRRPDLVRRGETYTPRLNLPKGERHPAAKLTDDQVREIRRMVANGAKQNAAAALFGVTKGTIWQIVRGHYWKHVT